MLPYAALAPAAALAALLVIPVPDPLRVCATTSNVAAIARAVGGDAVDVVVLASAHENPHRIDAKPEWVDELNRADALVVVGLGLESDWLPELLKRSRNAAVQPGARGYVDASNSIAPLDRRARRIQQAGGHVHAKGSPHYLLDPARAVRAAARLRDRLSTLRPASAAAFTANYDAFARTIGDRLFGSALAARYDWQQLCALADNGDLLGFLDEQGALDAVGGWTGRMLAHRSLGVIADHDVWRYLLKRLNLRQAGLLEPIHGVPPTKRHVLLLLRELENAPTVRALAVAPYCDDRNARFVTDNSHLRLARLVHQAGATAATSDYVDLIDHNVEQLLVAFEAGPN